MKLLFRLIRSFLFIATLGLILGLGLHQFRGLTEGVPAPVLIQQGTQLLEIGEAEAALETWQHAEQRYRAQNDTIGILGSQLNQAKALEELGFYPRSCQTILDAFGLPYKCKDLENTEIAQEAIQTIVNSKIDQNLLFISLQSLGNNLQLFNYLDSAQKFLEQSQFSAESSLQKSQVLLNLGNLQRRFQKNNEAIVFYQESAALSKDYPEINLQANLNQVSLLLEEKQWDKTTEILSQIREPLTILPSSQLAIYAQIKFATSQFCLQQKQTHCLRQQESIQPTEKNSQVEHLLQTALASANTLGSPRLQSYTLGTLGRFYEETQQLALAQDYIEKALKLSQQIQAPEIAYQWQWQLGRLLLKNSSQNNVQAAITAYLASVNSLQALRGNLAIFNQDIQFDFKQEVEPVYRKLVDLLLSHPDNQEVSQENLAKARDVIELLQLAKLDNFFQEACVEVQDVKIDEIDPNAAVFYSIFLENRLEVILSIPDQANPILIHSPSQIDNNQKFDDFLEGLSYDLSQKEEDITPANLEIVQNKLLENLSKVYQLFLTPKIEETLQKFKIKTLVFIPDGWLQSIPLAAAYDSDHHLYLIQKYAVVTIPGLKILEPNPLKSENMRVLAGGIKDFQNENFPEDEDWNNLKYVQQELEDIAKIVPTETLFNQELTASMLQKKINSSSFPVVHLATHGQFSPQADDTFIWAWGEKIKLNELGQLLRVDDPTRRKDIQLLILSACKTAEGNDKTLLGMAGAAIQSGSRSAIATLWNINDQSTANLMKDFYQEINQLINTDNPVNKAESLRQAQLNFLEGKYGQNYKNTYFWSPFILVGNWQ